MEIIKNRSGKWAHSRPRPPRRNTIGDHEVRLQIDAGLLLTPIVRRITTRAGAGAVVAIVATIMILRALL